MERERGLGGGGVYRDRAMGESLAKSCSSLVGRKLEAESKRSPDRQAAQRAGLRVGW